MDKKKLLTTGLASALCLTIGGVTIACTPNEGGDPPPPVSHEITATVGSASIEVGQNSSISLDVSTMDGEEFTYAMDQTGIVYYNPAQGKLYGLKAGTVNITFMVKGQPSISKTITITVTPLSTQYDVVIGDSDAIKVTHGNKIEKPADPTKESSISTDYTFDCWVKEGTDIEWDFDTPVTGPVTLVAKWTESVRKYSVTFNGVTDYYEYGTKFSKPADPTKDMTISTVYTFDNWYIKGTNNVWNFLVNKVEGEVEIEARFIETARKYAVTIDGITENIDYGSLLVKPNDPSKESSIDTVYTFDNWYIKGTDNV